MLLQMINVYIVDISVYFYTVICACIISICWTTGLGTISLIHRMKHFLVYFINHNITKNKVRNYFLLYQKCLVFWVFFNFKLRKSEHCKVFFFRIISISYYIFIFRHLSLKGVKFKHMMFSLLKKYRK